jgi:DNA-binding response OmpR family regulator
MHILIVEDDEIARDYLAKALREAGHTVDVAGNGLEGLHLASSIAVDLAIVDRMLPKLDGLQVLRYLREFPETEVIPVIVMSSSDEPMDRLQSYRLGANSYIRKPVDFARFVETMKTLATYWFCLNEGPPRGIELG